MNAKNRKGCVRVPRLRTAQQLRDLRLAAALLTEVDRPQPVLGDWRVG